LRRKQREVFKESVGLKQGDQTHSLTVELETKEEKRGGQLNSSVFRQCKKENWRKKKVLDKPPVPMAMLEN